MKYFIYLFLLAAIFTSCKRNSKLVANAYADSLMAHYTYPPRVAQNTADMQFWKNRIDPKRPGQVSESKYASALVLRFRLLGDIHDVKKADSVLKAVNKRYHNTLAGPFVALTGTAMLQHHFERADTLLQTAAKLGVDGFTQTTLSFDVNFETGRYREANAFLQKEKSDKDYSYYFRQSKMDHFTSNLDSAIVNMRRAADLEKNEPLLRGIALSNTADLYLHAGDLNKAAALYKQCIDLNNADFHSILGLGWLALVHDKNDTLAEKLFKFVLTKNKLPDPLFKLYQMAQQRGDKALEKQYASEFVVRSTDAIYGRMYNKYVIEIYTGILNQPAKAELLAKDELKNRTTPQTYAWYAYALFKNNKKDEADMVFEKHVSGQPLEGLELYYMAKLMKGLDKGYDAGEFFKAAGKNKYDLSPGMEKDLEANLEE